MQTRAIDCYSTFKWLADQICGPLPYEPNFVLIRYGKCHFVINVRVN